MKKKSAAIFFWGGGGMSYLCYGLIVLFCKFRVLLFGIITLVHDYVIILI